MSEVDPKLFNEMVQAVHGLSAIAWRLQARLNVMELICLQTIEDVARAQPDPKEYMRQYVRRAAARPTFADVHDPSKKEQTEKEMKAALDDFLEVVLTRAADLKT